MMNTAGKPPTQLPAGRYPASPTTAWVVAALAVAIGVVLALGIPALGVLGL